ncbi:hypothetical protein F2Q70_00026095 [Brassica cretica]|uniref:Uncharacterized protein n=1 Tax=Brassica cretica TaxID=69181 RepID=A0A8S9LGL5_BRACR|nr:hypothetical protein F2Q70_00026095 [Brassica cretica]
MADDDSNAMLTPLNGGGNNGRTLQQQTFPRKTQQPTPRLSRSLKRCSPPMKKGRKNKISSWTP